MQLVAYGAQDVYLTGNPKVTFFQAVYKRHTNFAMETIEQTVNGTVSPNGRVSVTIARNGDLIGDMFLEMKTKDTVVSKAGVTGNSGCWVAERAISSVELTIGGQRIDKHYQRWWRLYSELYLSADQKDKYAKMTTNALATATESNRVYLPLIFFFNRNAGLYLPLIALQYHEVRLDIDLSSVFDTYLETSGFKVWGNYVYLDTEERRRFAQKGHEYLIEQVQHTGTDDAGSSGSAKQIRLSYNHPIKELVWCVNSGVTTSEHQMWNFTTLNATDDVVLESNAAAVAGLSSLNTAFGVPQLVTTGNHYSVGEDGKVTTWNAVGPLDTFKLILNGQDRFKEQSGKYFNQVQPYCHHAGVPMPGVYSYSFALKPEEHQPTGTCNFSRIDNAQVEIKTKANMAAGTTNTLHMFAVNYNVLRIQSGINLLSQTADVKSVLSASPVACC